ncbi:hypothetical protein BH18THE2_BH18THE2_37950 [soil metagenome]
MTVVDNTTSNKDGYLRCTYCDSNLIVIKTIDGDIIPAWRKLRFVFSGNQNVIVPVCVTCSKDLFFRGDIVEITKEERTFYGDNESDFIQQIQPKQLEDLSKEERSTGK